MKTNPYSHFYLYAKKWYQKSDSLDNDLLKILSNYSGCPVSSLTRSDLLTVLLEIVWFEIGQEGKHVFDYFVLAFVLALITGTSFEVSVLSVLASAPSGRIDSKRLPLAKPDSSIFPIDENALEFLDGFWPKEDDE